MASVDPMNLRIRARDDHTNRSIDDGASRPARGYHFDAGASLPNRLLRVGKFYAPSAAKSTVVMIIFLSSHEGAGVIALPPRYSGNFSCFGSGSQKLASNPTA